VRPKSSGHGQEFMNAPHDPSGYKSNVTQEKKVSENRRNSEQEVDVYTNPTKLFELINQREWGLAKQHAVEHPREVRTWIASRGSKDKRKIKFRYLPLHVACLHPNPPYLLLRTLLDLHPESAKQCDHAGNLPVHYICTQSAEGGPVLDMLMDSYPQCLAKRNKKGHKPIQIIEKRTLSESFMQQNKAELLNQITNWEQRNINSERKVEQGTSNREERDPPPPPAPKHQHPSPQKHLTPYTSEDVFDDEDSSHPHGEELEVQMRATEPNNHSAQRIKELEDQVRIFQAKSESLVTKLYTTSNDKIKLEHQISEGNLTLKENLIIEQDKMTQLWKSENEKLRNEFTNEIDSWKSRLESREAEFAAKLHREKRLLQETKDRNAAKVIGKHEEIEEDNLHSIDSKYKEEFSSPVADNKDVRTLSGAENDYSRKEAPRSDTVSASKIEGIIQRLTNEIDEKTAAASKNERAFKAKIELLEMEISKKTLKLKVMEKTHTKHDNVIHHRHEQDKVAVETMQGMYRALEEKYIQLEKKCSSVEAQLIVKQEERQELITVIRSFGPTMKSGKEKERLSVDEVEKIANSLEEIAVANRKYKKKLHELLYDV